MRVLSLVASFVVIIFLISNSIQMTSIRQFIQRHQTALLRVSFVVLVLYWIRAMLVAWSANWAFFTYAHYPLDDWMINYEGGFVRRGLIGQILYELYQIQAYPLQILVMLIIILCLVAFIALVIRLYIHEKWSLASLTAIPFLGAAIATPTFFRRDFLMLIAVYCVFYALKKFWEKKTYGWWLCIQCLAVFSILSHEATFFFMLPIMVWVHWMHLKQQNVTLLKVVNDVCVLFLLPTIAMMACVLYKGNIDVVTAIWRSWEPCMNMYPLPGDITSLDNGVNALLWDTYATFKKHFVANFTVEFWKQAPWIPSYPFLLLSYIMVYFLVVKMNAVDLRWNLLEAFDSVVMSNVLLLQFFFLLPMFTVLSCDVTRVTSYWIFSSLFAYHFFRDRALYPMCLTRLSESILQVMQDRKCLSSPWTYMLVLWTLPMEGVGGPTLFSSVLMKTLNKILSFAF